MTVISSHIKSIAFLANGGEMGTLIHGKDWSENLVGIPENWPQSLRTTLSIILNSKFPMLLFWGPELICFYNDAYRPSLGQDGKHPSILGMKAEDAWLEIWPIIKPLLDQVLNGGESTWSEDQLLPIYRNGKLEDAYWTFSYSAVVDETGKVAGVLTTCSETTAKIIGLKKLNESKDELEFAIEATELGTFDFCPQTNKFAANERLKNWFGLSHTTEIDLSTGINVVAEVDRKRVINEINKALLYESGGNYDVEYAIVNPLTKIKRIVHCKARVWFNADKIAYRFNGTLQDVTERITAKLKQQEIHEDQKNFSNDLEKLVHKRTLELEQKNIDLQNMNKELESFAYISSHDLQEPLRKIQTFSSQIVAEELDKLSNEGKENFQRMQNAAQRMQTLIEDLLLYSRTNTTERSYEFTDLKSLVKEVIDELKEDIKEKQATIEFDNMCGASIVNFQFKQLIQNLITNSLKFSHDHRKSHIKISAKIISGKHLANSMLKQDVNYCHIQVTDNGIGFEQQYSDRIFQVFQRLHGRSQYKGTGIGLSIVKKIVDNHNGIITAHGEQGVGATFNIYFPVNE